MTKHFALVAHWFRRFAESVSHRVRGSIGSEAQSFRRLGEGHMVGGPEVGRSWVPMIRGPRRITPGEVECLGFKFHAQLRPTDATFAENDEDSQQDKVPAPGSADSGINFRLQILRSPHTSCSTLAASTGIIPYALLIGLTPTYFR